mmetsp:Transcript_30382/g.55077  ORF Transcript_30382/g.55077 Transcript_30382/m.55077 type:complete len:509 (-) Transcript_30382:90-1616(-)|eukprot:CAMPEP_0201912976 /NCGR_PEP_ID=MMETSP0903-20130614/3505_1 /ASSEMBLY_ACC=CAM_ASM_000552 /TAXON_ID=420261 /ORGANISM="Thalassiosira antarctica, Strain CCMP982" /LENGTH=508 /DNA_ID=CAMNT_0048448053 /DNA_START=26 /DNA_END=1552 /DNA_ORIENTATION=-
MTGSLSLRGLLLPLLVASASAAATTLVDSAGSLTKALLPSPTEGDGIVALLSSPGTPSLFSSSTTVNFDNNVISAPGASLEESSRAIGAAAAGSIAGAVVMTGVTLADVEVGLDGTRHGRTLAELFASVLRMDKKKGVTTLMIAVQYDSDESGSLNSEEIEEVVEEIFDSVAAAVGSDDELSDYFSIQSTFVSTSDDVAKVMSAAQSAAKSSAPTKSLPTAFSDIYKQITSASDDADPTPVAEAILACNDAYCRASRTSRAKIASWKHRVSRNLLVPKFGIHADALLTRTLDLFDRDTMAAAGLPRAGEQRLMIRKKLQDRTEGIFKRLFDDQMAILEKNTLKRFQMTLLRKMVKDMDASQFFESNAEALRTAAFAFESTASSLEVPSISLSKSKAIQEMEGKLNNALMTFPDSPAAKIKSLQKVGQTVSKKKDPTDGSIDVTLDIVAMIRPDGFGNLQGFAGYQMGPHSVTVGVHNDADDPGVISQFGGVRPPFFRVQPKLKLEVEL